MMMNFMAVTEKGNPICKLSVIAIMSPQTLISANTPGIIDARIIVPTITKARRFARNLCRRLSLSSGHRPRIFREIRLIPIAHSKSTRPYYHGVTLIEFPGRGKGRELNERA